MFRAPEIEGSEASDAHRTGLTYVLGHGFTGSAEGGDIDTIARFLQSRGASVLVPSFRGHGTSEGLSTVGDLEVHDLEACVEWVHSHLPDDRLVTLGFSMGASIVVRHAGLGGSTDAVVAVSGPGRWYERGTRPMRLVHFGVETRLGRLILRRAFKTRVHPSGWAELPEAPVEVAGRVEAPMLVVHGDSDGYFGLEHARMLAAAAPRAELWIEEGMGHAENSTTTELMGRIDTWCRAAVGLSETMLT